MFPSGAIPMALATLWDRMSVNASRRPERRVEAAVAEVARDRGVTDQGLGAGVRVRHPGDHDPALGVQRHRIGLVAQAAVERGRDDAAGPELGVEAPFRR